MPRHDAVPKTVKPRYDEIVELVDAVCRTHLTEEYAALTRDLAAAVARKRPSPLLRGQSRTWACGLTYTIGSVNFLFDPAQQPHVRGADLCTLFGVSPSAGAAKSREIMRLFDIVPLDPRWSLPSRLAENPLVWMIPVNGVIVDMRMMPRERQEQAYALGLIPFVPATHGDFHSIASEQLRPAGWGRSGRILRAGISSFSALRPGSPRGAARIAGSPPRRTPGCRSARACIESP
jgi:Domain of unknown function (DUF6398)